MASQKPQRSTDSRQPLHTIHSVQVLSALHRRHLALPAEACCHRWCNAHVPTLEAMKCSFRAFSSLLRVLPSTNIRFASMQSSLSQPAVLPAAARRQWRAASGGNGPRRSGLGLQLCNGLGSKQRQPLDRQQRLVAAASTAAAEAAAEAAAPSSSQRKELPKNFDPAASEEGLYQW